MHAQFVEQSDLDLEAGSRWLAIWEISGQSIALANGLVDQVEAGHVAALAGPDGARATLVDTR